MIEITFFGVDEYHWRNNMLQCVVFFCLYFYTLDLFWRQKSEINIKNMAVIAKKYHGFGIVLKFKNSISGSELL